MIIGLGNPGLKYENTRHNVGFKTINYLAKIYEADFEKSSFEVDFAKTLVYGQKILLVKPQTFMNHSGRVIPSLMNYFDIQLDNLLIVYDDIDLKLGNIRFRSKGSSGGHNGLKSLIFYLNTEILNRLKIGIGRPKNSLTVVEHVLENFSQKEELIIKKSIIKAKNLIENFIKCK